MADEVTWPDFEVPTEALLPDAARDAVTTTIPPAIPPAAATPPATVPATAPAAGAPGTTEPPAGTTQTPPVETVPKFRLDEVIGARDAATQRAERLEAELRHLRSQPPPVAAAPPPPAASTPPVDPEVAERNEAIRTRMLELFPELKGLKDFAELAARKGDIVGATEAIQRYNTAEEKFYDRHVQTQLSSLHTLAAAHVLGDGKTAEELPEMVRDMIAQRFSDWIKSDPARTARFDDLDTKLVGEFWPIFRAAVYDPIRRASSAAAVTSAIDRPALPVGGSIAAPVAPAPPKPASSDDEDAIHSRAWQGVLAAR